MPTSTRQRTQSEASPNSERTLEELQALRGAAIVTRHSFPRTHHDEGAPEELKGAPVVRQAVPMGTSLESMAAVHDGNVNRTAVDHEHASCALRGGELQSSSRRSNSRERANSLPDSVRSGGWCAGLMKRRRQSVPASCVDGSAAGWSDTLSEPGVRLTDAAVASVSGASGSANLHEEVDDSSLEVLQRRLLLAEVRANEAEVGRLLAEACILVAEEKAAIAVREMAADAVSMECVTAAVTALTETIIQEQQGVQAAKEMGSSSRSPPSSVWRRAVGLTVMWPVLAAFLAYILAIWEELALRCGAWAAETRCLTGERQGQGGGRRLAHAIQSMRSEAGGEPEMDAEELRRRVRAAGERRRLALSHCLRATVGETVPSPACRTIGHGCGEANPPLLPLGWLWILCGGVWTLVRNRILR